jgi:ADP-ribose pyrophosphatase YjhB (NUDIX family)
MSREYPDHPRVGVGVIVWRDGRVLLVRRTRPPQAGEWSLPGGGQELGETLFETARREVAEETGLEVAPTGVLTAVDSIHRDEAGRVRFHYTLIDVLADWQSGEAAPRDDVSAVVWATPEEAERLVAWSETRRVIRLAGDRHRDGRGVRSPAFRARKGRRPARATAGSSPPRRPRPRRPAR